MRKASALLLVGVLVLLPGCFAAGMPQLAPVQKKKKSAKPVASKTPSRAIRGHKGPATPTRLVRNKAGRLTRVVVHAPPAPTFQTRPDPERYIEIQKALVDRGYFKGEPNGEWGDDSVDALRRYQASANLPDDGKISALTLTGLGLGPRHDGSSASTVPMAQSPTTPTVVGSTVGPAASTPSQTPVPHQPPDSH